MGSYKYIFIWSGPIDGHNWLHLENNFHYFLCHTTPHNTPSQWQRRRRRIRRYLWRCWWWRHQRAVINGWCCWAAGGYLDIPSYITFVRKLRRKHFTTYTRKTKKKPPPHLVHRKHCILDVITFIYVSFCLIVQQCFSWQKINSSSAISLTIELYNELELHRRLPGRRLSKRWWWTGWRGWMREHLIAQRVIFIRFIKQQKMNNNKQGSLGSSINVILLKIKRVSCGVVNIQIYIYVKEFPS